jgi:hypothetical protein
MLCGVRVGRPAKGGELRGGEPEWVTMLYCVPASDGCDLKWEA